MTTLAGRFHSFSEEVTPPLDLGEDLLAGGKGVGLEVHRPKVRLPRRGQ